MQLGFLSSTVERGRQLKLLGANNNDLIAYLKFNVADGNLGINSAVGSNSIGNFTVSGTNPPTTGSGLDAEGAEFVGNTSCYLKYAGTTSKSVKTLSMWFYLTDGDLAEQRVLCGFQGTGTLDVAFYVSPTQFRYYSTSYGNNVSVNHGLTITGGQWHHIGFTQVGTAASNWKFYFDGVQYGATSSSASASTLPVTYQYTDHYEWRLGFGSTNWTGMTHQKNMVIDNVRMFTTALSEADMAVLAAE